MKRLKWVRTKINRSLWARIPLHKRRKILGFLAVAFIFFIVIGHDMLTSISVNTFKGKMVRDYRAPNLTDTDITLVTMYLNIGPLTKGYSTRTPEQYLEWMNAWAWITNPVVAFFEDKDSLEKFRQARSAQPLDRTIIYKVSRGELKAFANYLRVKAIFSDPQYPKHDPNTMNAEYACTMAAKVDALEVAIDKKLIKTKYVAWVDLGYFRLLREPRFAAGRPVVSLEAPTGYNPSTIGFSELQPSTKVFSLTPQQIIARDISWVATGFILGTPELISSYITDFRSAREELLAKGLTSSCQQIVAALYSGQLTTKARVKVSTYTCRTGQFGLYRPYDRDYYCLGYLCKQMAQGRTIDDTVVIV